MSGESSTDINWPALAEMAGVAAFGFAIGLVVGYIRAPRKHREAVNQYVSQYVMETISERTRTVLAVLKVSIGYYDDEIETELVHPGDIIQGATVISMDGERSPERPPYHSSAF